MYKKIILISLFAASSLSFGQNVAQMSTTELNMQLQSLINQGNWDGSRTYADELISRFNGSGDANASKDTLINLYYFRAYSYFQTYLATKANSNVGLAIGDLEKIIDTKEVSPQVRKAIDLKALCHESQGDYKSSAEALGVLLAPPYVYQMKASEQLGLIRRIVSNLYAQRAWEGNDKWFTRLLENSNLSADKMMAASALMQSAISRKDFDEAMKYLPYTTIKDPARYDISLNVSFLEAARELSDPSVERYADASVFYSLCYNKATIVKFFQEYKAEQQAIFDSLKENKPDSVLLPLVEGRVNMASGQLKALDSIEEYASILSLGKAINYQATKRMYESYWAYTQMIDAFPDSEQIQEYYFYAFLAALDIEKQDDMAALGEEYLKKFPNGKFLKDIKLQMIVFYQERSMYDEFFSASYGYVDAYNADKTVETVVFLMGSTWLAQSNFSDLIRTFENFIRKYPNSTVVDALNYWVGLAYMATGDYEKSFKNFKEVVDNFPESAYLADAFFRMGIASYGGQDIEGAEKIFKDFVKEHSYSELAGEAEFFLGDICVAKGASNEALVHYGEVEKKTTAMEHIDNAYEQSVSLQNQASNYKAIIELADQYINKYPTANVAIMLFEKANAFNETGMSGDTLLIYKKIILEYGNNPLLSGVDKAIEKYISDYKPTVEKLKATKEFIELALKDEELLTTLTKDAGARYRYFLERPIIDKEVYLKFKSDEKFSVNLLEDPKPLKDLLAHVNNQISKVPAEAPSEFFNAVLEENKGKNPTLEFRAMMALDKFLKAPIPARNFNVEDYKNASPSTLIWIAKLNEKYSAKEAINTYQYILDSFTDKQYLFEALMGLAQFHVAQGDFDNALSLYERLENEFPSEEKSWLAIMEYGETLIKDGKTMEARDKFESIRRNPSWRGEAFAGALYNLGRISESRNAFEEALNYYDNCAIGHSNFIAYSGKAALAEIKLYQKMGESEKAMDTAKAFLETASAKQAAEYQSILDISNNL